MVLRVQEGSMPDHERNALLRQMRTGEQHGAHRGSRRCLLGGFDYLGDMAIGAFVISPGLPNFNREQELIRQYFDKVYGKAFKYAYRNPGINKVVQAAGRIFRSDTDRGFVVLVGRRFATDYYRDVLPVLGDGGDGGRCKRDRGVLEED